MVFARLDAAWQRSKADGLTITALCKIRCGFRNNDHPRQQPLAGTEVGCPLAAALEHQQLLFKEQILAITTLPPPGPSSVAIVTIKCANSAKIVFIS